MPKYLDIPMTYEFLTGMSSLIFLSTVGPKWDCAPCTPAEIKTFLTEGETSNHFQKDVGRAHWLFGEREEEGVEAERKEGIEEKGIQASRRKKPFQYIKNPSGTQSESKQPPFISALIEASHNPAYTTGEKKVDLREDESGALWTFAHSVGERYYLQAGAMRGVNANCFRSCWLMRTMKIFCPMTADRDYEEGQRVSRMKDGSLKVSSYEASSQMLDLSVPSSQTKDASGGDYYYEFCSEQVMQEHGRTEEDRFFTLAPHRQTLKMEESFWMNSILAHAGKRLAQATLLNPQDFFAFIPCLQDENFRKLFSEKLALQEEDHFQFAKRWISKCFAGEELNSILTAIAEKRKAVLENNLLKTPLPCQTLEDYLGMRIYRRDPAYHGTQRNSIETFLENLKDSSALEYMELLYDLAGQTCSPEVMDREISIAEGAELHWALRGRLMEKMATCSEDHYHLVLRRYGRSYKNDLNAFSSELLPKRIQSFTGGTATHDLHLLQELEKLEKRVTVSGIEEKSHSPEAMEKLHAGLTDRLIQKMARCSPADYEKILADRKTNSADFTRFYLRVVLERIKNSQAGTARQVWGLLQEVEKLKNEMHVTAPQKKLISAKDLQGIHQDLTSRLIPKLAYCSLANYNEILRDRVKNSPDPTQFQAQFYSQIQRGARLRNRVKNFTKGRDAYGQERGIHEDSSKSSTAKIAMATQEDKQVHETKGGPQESPKQASGRERVPEKQVALPKVGSLSKFSQLRALFKRESSTEDLSATSSKKKAPRPRRRSSTQSDLE